VHNSGGRPGFPDLRYITNRDYSCATAPDFVLQHYHLGSENITGFAVTSRAIRGDGNLNRIDYSITTSSIIPGGKIVKLRWRSFI